MGTHLASIWEHDDSALHRQSGLCDLHSRCLVVLYRILGSEERVRGCDGEVYLGRLVMHGYDYARRESVRDGGRGLVIDGEVSTDGHQEHVHRAYLLDGGFVKQMAEIAQVHQPQVAIVQDADGALAALLAAGLIVGRLDAG